MLPANPRFTAEPGASETEPADADSADAEPTDGSEPSGDTAPVDAVDAREAAAVGGAVDSEESVPRPYMLRMSTESPTLMDDGEPTFRLPRTVPLVQPGDAVRAAANTVQIFRNDLTGG